MASQFPDAHLPHGGSPAADNHHRRRKTEPSLGPLGCAITRWVVLELLPWESSASISASAQLDEATPRVRLILGLDLHPTLRVELVPIPAGYPIVVSSTKSLIWLRSEVS